MFTLVDPKIEELTCENCLQNKCLNKEFCVIAFLTREEEFPESVEIFNQHVSLLQVVKKKLYGRKKAVDFAWTNAISHGSQLIKDFGVSDMFPSLMVIDPTKKQYSLLRTAFDEKSITTWLDIFLSGGGRTPYTKTPYLDKPAKDVNKDKKSTGSKKVDQAKPPKEEKIKKDSTVKDEKDHEEL